MNFRLMIKSKNIFHNDVPYPVILGTDYVYFMLDQMTVDRLEFPDKMTKLDWDDACQLYYFEKTEQVKRGRKIIHNGH
jgi:hypothetical protein